MAAHNLRESLRDVAAFSQLMAETYADRPRFRCRRIPRPHPGGGGKNAVAAHRRGGLLDRGCRRAGSSPRRTWKRSFARRSSARDKQIAERSAIVTHDPLPPVCGDFEILTKVLHHLIRNAIEYCDAPSPRVHISCRRVDPEWVFSVQDNGPGIEPAFHGRMFGAFKRLHGKEYPGNGLGLAFCKKAIEAAWRPHVDGVDTWGGIDLLFRVGSCGVSLTPPRDASPGAACEGDAIRLRGISCPRWPPQSIRGYVSDNRSPD